MRIYLLLIVVTATCLACSNSETRRYSAAPRSDGEVRRALAETCRTALDTKRPVLVEFSAPWCSDCQRLHELKQEPALAGELAEWPNMTINVGMFDLHRDLLDAFGIEKIAHWSIFQPTDCSAPVEAWPRVEWRTLEPSSGAERDTSPRQLADWLRAFRTS